MDAADVEEAADAADGEGAAPGFTFQHLTSASSPVGHAAVDTKAHRLTQTAGEPASCAHSDTGSWGSCSAAQVAHAHTQTAGEPASHTQQDDGFCPLGGVCTDMQSRQAGAASAAAAAAEQSDRAGGGHGVGRAADRRQGIDGTEEGWTEVMGNEVRGVRLCMYVCAEGSL